MHLLKQFILYKWASDGLTKEQVLEGIKGAPAGSVNESSDLVKAALVPEAYDFLTKVLPGVALVGPLIGGGVIYAVTHPAKLRNKINEDRRKRLDNEIAAAISSNKKKHVVHDVPFNKYNII